MPMYMTQLLPYFLIICPTPYSTERLYTYNAGDVQTYFLVSEAFVPTVTPVGPGKVTGRNSHIHQQV